MVVCGVMSLVCRKPLFDSTKDAFTDGAARKKTRTVREKSISDGRRLGAKSVSGTNRINVCATVKSKRCRENFTGAALQLRPTDPDKSYKNLVPPFLPVKGTVHALSPCSCRGSERTAGDRVHLRQSEFSGLKSNRFNSNPHATAQALTVEQRMAKLANTTSGRANLSRHRSGE